MIATGFIPTDAKQISGLVHQRNVFFKTIKECQAILADYILPDDITHPAIAPTVALNRLIGILNDKELIKEM
jgi:hypothetical protein